MCCTFGPIISTINIYALDFIFKDIAKDLTLDIGKLRRCDDQLVTSTREGDGGVGERGVGGRTGGRDSEADAVGAVRARADKKRAKAGRRKVKTTKLEDPR
jgi:hypothetical protein